MKKMWWIIIQWVLIFVCLTLLVIEDKGTKFILIIFLFHMCSTQLLSDLKDYGDQLRKELKEFKK